jgi:hypothetical protein
VRVLVFSPNELGIAEQAGGEFLMMGRREFIAGLGGATVYPQQRTFVSAVGTSVQCHKLSSRGSAGVAPGQITDDCTMK